MIALVIDDSRAMRRIVAEMLRGAGFETLQAGDGQAALDLLAERSAAGEPAPALACVDWNMPVLDGLQFVLAARKLPELRSMTLMMVTTEGEQSRIVRALAAGAHEYLIKPFGKDAFYEKLTWLGLLPAEATL